MRFSVPESMKDEHSRLLGEMRSAARSGGKVGALAKEASKIMEDHFRKEELFAFPSLRLFGHLSSGKFRMEMKDVLSMTDRFAVEMYQMVEEHKELASLLDGLASAAAEEKKPRWRGLVEALKSHIQTEDAVLYLAALFIGKYVHERVEMHEYERHSAGCC